MTAPVRVMKRGLENLSVLDLSCKCTKVSHGLSIEISHAPSDLVNSYL